MTQLYIYIVCFSSLLGASEIYPYFPSSTAMHLKTGLSIFYTAGYVAAGFQYIEFTLGNTSYTENTASTILFSTALSLILKDHHRLSWSEPKHIGVLGLWHVMINVYLPYNKLIEN